MSNAPITEEEAIAAKEAYLEHGTKLQAAKALGIPRTTFDRHLKRAAEKGMLGYSPVLPGFHVTKISTTLDEDGEKKSESIQTKPEYGEPFEMPIGHRIKGVSVLLDQNDEQIAKWVKTREDDLDPEELIAWLKEAFKDYEPAARVTPTPENTSGKDLLTFIPLADWHVGMYAWNQEVDENWDLKIAEKAIGGSVDDLISRSPVSEECVILGGGDLIHSDNNQNMTTRSKNVLQVDGRYQKVVSCACRLVARTVDAALARHHHVSVRILPGNHDEHACVAVAYFLHAWYRNEPRVTVDTDPSLFWWCRFGLVMLGATHGHTGAKIKDMPQIMAHRRAKDWGATKFRYVHGFHLHHTAKFATEGGGVISEIHQAPVPQDAWHYGAGYLSGRSLQAITYHRDFGDIGRVRVALLDADIKAKK